MSGWEEVQLPEIPRDTFKRPLIIPPDGGNAKPYTRVTTYVGALEDTYNLGLWQQRMVGLGLSLRPEFMLRISSLGPEPPKIIERIDEKTGEVTWVPNTKYRPWVDAMNEVCEQAKEAAQAHAKATIGTSLHALAERFDRDEIDLSTTVPTDYLPHLGAYATQTEGWEWLHIERFMVNDELKVGGTPDRVARVPGHPRPVIADIKTGDVTFGVGKMAMQLAVYAHCQVYDVDGTRTPLPADIDQEMGLIIALDATRGTCEVLRIDIAAGWVAVQLATQVRAWRSHRGLTEPWRPTLAARTPKPPALPRHSRPAWANMPSLDSDTSLALISAIQRAESVDELTAIWRSVRREAWTDVFTRHAAERKQRLSA